MPSAAAQPKRCLLFPSSFPSSVPIAPMQVSPLRARELSLRSPVLLLVPRLQLEAKLQAMQAATALSAEACSAMLTVHMFPELRLGS